MTLSPRDFRTFFEEVYGHDPFPWQGRLLEQVADQGEWPEVIDLPTGSGKTATIDIAVFHLALEADRQETRKAPVRIAFVVDRRLVVDDAFTRAKVLAAALATPRGQVTARVAAHLNALSSEPEESRDRRPLIARRLRGGIPREDDWARTPSQPTILCSTVDQIGSRLLFRGYGVSDSMKPVHAGLIGADCLILLDEAHLAEPFRQTLQWVQRYRGQDWREANEVAPWAVALLTATPGEKSPHAFALNDEDKKHPILKKRLSAAKPARLIAPTRTTAKTEDLPDTDEEDDMDDSENDQLSRALAIVREVGRALAHFESPANDATAPAIAVVVNRVSRARAVFDRLTKEFKAKIDAGTIELPILMIGPARPVDRDELAGVLDPIRTQTWKEGEKRTLDKALILVATQCIEAGVDIDLDALITEAAPLDTLRQRFGRLNRAGRHVVPYSAILATKQDISPRHDDPVYGRAIKPAWDCLINAAKKERNELIVDFGLNAFRVALQRDACSPKPDAPVLMPAYLDLLSHTSPIPAADPEVALYFHGPNRQPDSITVVWRADIGPEHGDADVRRLLTLAQPRASEAVQLPLWAVRRWLENTKTLDFLADAAAATPDEERTRVGAAARRVFRWKGDDDRSRWIVPRKLRAGDAIVVPAIYGGVDQFGWNPQSAEPASDLARKAALPFKGRRFTVRVAPGLMGEAVTDEMLADALAGAECRTWQEARSALLDLPLPAEIRDDLAVLDDANRKRVAAPYLDIYGTTGDRPRGVVFVAPFGIQGGRHDEEGSPNATEGDTSGSLLGFSLTLAQHSADVESKAELFARSAGLSKARIRDLKLSGFLHDAGKVDPRFQRWLHYGDPLGPDLDDTDAVLAKSGRPLPPAARAGSGLPENWRHEALSVRLAPHAARFAEAEDPELVLWLIGAHHGHGRPFFPHCDPDDEQLRRFPAVSGLASELPRGSGPQSLAFDWNGFDWSALFARLKARYGVWGLAHMEAVLRLADHRASEDAKEQRK